MNVQEALSIADSGDRFSKDPLVVLAEEVRRLTSPSSKSPEAGAATTAAGTREEPTLAELHSALLRAAGSLGLIVRGHANPKARGHMANYLNAVALLERVNPYAKDITDVSGEEDNNSRPISSEKKAENLCRFLSNVTKEGDAVKRLHDFDLVLAIIDGVVSKLDVSMDSREYALFEELMDRFEAKSGIHRDDNCELIDPRKAHAPASGEDDARVNMLTAELQSMLRQVPATDGQGGFFHMHYDENGKELGPEAVNPMSVVEFLVGTTQRAIDAAQRPAPQAKEEGK